MKNLFLGCSLALVLVFCASFLSAQCTHNHQSTDRNLAKELLTIAEIDSRYQSDLEELPKEFKKDFERAYTNRKDYLAKQLGKGQFLFDTPINEMLERVFKNITKANPDIDKNEIRVMLNRSSSVNAASYGDGTIDFNLGLFTQLQNEDQLAFVMCHEIAHYQRNHGNKAIERKIKKVNSKNFKAKVKDIKKSDYDKYTKSEALLSDLIFSVAKHSKSKEIEADRIGYEYFNNTDYDSLQAMTLLRVLDASDKGGSEKVDVQKFFDFEGYAFNPLWLKEDQSFHENGKQKLRGRAAKLANLKTHPDCEERIRKLTDEQYDSLLYVNNTITPKMESIRTSANMEIIQFYYEKGDIGKVVYESMAMIESGHVDHFLFTMISKSMFELYNAQKNRSVGKIIGTAHPSYSNEYNQLLTLLNNLTSKDVAGIHDAFIKERQCASSGSDKGLVQEINAYLQGGNDEFSEAVLVQLGASAKKRFENMSAEESNDLDGSKKTLSKKEKKKVGNIMAFNFSSLNPMIKDGKIRGYFLYYKKELKDKNTVAYEVIVYDQNLNQFAKKTISGSKELYMIEGSYNGEAFCFKMYDGSERKIKFKLFDNNFASLGTKSVEIKGNLEDMPVLGQTKNENDEVGEKTIFPIEGLGFATIIPGKEEGQAYQIKMYPQIKGEKGWTFESETLDDRLINIKFVGQNEETLFFEILKANPDEPSSNGFAILGIEKKTGVHQFETYLNCKEFNYFVNTTAYDKTTNSIIALGNYVNNASLFAYPTGNGIGQVSLTEDGEITSRDHISWKEDLANHLQIRDDGHLEGQGYLFTHKILRGYDNNQYIIGEFYNRASSQMTLKDLVVLQLDKDFNLISATTQKKKESNFKNPSKSGKMPPYIVAKIARLNREFDYSYTLTDDNAKVMTICYRDNQGAKKEDGTVFKMLAVQEDGNRTEDEIVLNNQNRTIRIMPGKEGFFVVAEYDFENKSLSLRQERVAY